MWGRPPSPRTSPGTRSEVPLLLPQRHVTRRSWDRPDGARRRSRQRPQPSLGRREGGTVRGADRPPSRVTPGLTRGPASSSSTARHPGEAGIAQVTRAAGAASGPSLRWGDVKAGGRRTGSPFPRASARTRSGLPLLLPRPPVIPAKAGIAQVARAAGATSDPSLSLGRREGWRTSDWFALPSRVSPDSIRAPASSPSTTCHPSEGWDRPGRARRSDHQRPQPFAGATPSHRNVTATGPRPSPGYRLTRSPPSPRGGSGHRHPRPSRWRADVPCRS